MKLFIITIAAFVLPGIALARDCRRDALAAEKSKTHDIVFSFEGLASYAAGFVRNGLIEELPDTFVSKNFAYTQDDDAYDCTKDFQAVLGAKMRVFVVGHSFGAGIAVPNYLARFPKGSVIHGVVTLDPRSWTSDSTYGQTKDLFMFRRNADLKINAWVNYFQRGGMPGYKVKGAINVPINDSSHVRMPKQDPVKNTLKELLR